jgi:hypothetical protein
MPHLQIQFSEEWTKLLTFRDPTPPTYNRYLKTMRLSTPSKLDYYTSSKGKTFDIILKDKKIGKVVLENVSTKILGAVTDLEIEEDTYDYWNRSEFYNFMKHCYSRTKEWKEWNTELIELQFRRI